ncbi:MAG: 50S ribosomal protein L9 [Candidatus Aminicenantes bacterium]|nr:50S ribosomal protein L9 [Candidatus Aminicenantes bacterium]
MRVMLREHVENLGKKGDIVNVAAGYGRNYLLPNKMAIKVTADNKKMIAIEQKALKKGFEKEMSTFKELIGRLDEQVLSFSRKTSEKDVIFGSVSSTDIKEGLEKLGFQIEKKKILLDEPIKRLGNYTVPIKIFHEERAQVKIEVIKEGEPSKKEIQEETAPAEGKKEALIETKKETAQAVHEEPLDKGSGESTKGEAAEESGEEAAAEIRQDTTEQVEPSPDAGEKKE